MKITTYSAFLQDLPLSTGLEVFNNTQGKNVEKLCFSLLSIRVGSYLASITRGSAILKPLREALRSDPSVVAIKCVLHVTTSSHHCRRNHKRRRNTWHGYLPGTGAHGHESILPPSGKKCPVRGGFRFLRSARRPDPVCNCYQ